MKNNTITENLSKPISRFQLIDKICTGKVVLDIGCVEHSSQNSENNTWLHKHISKVAKRVVGVDYLQDDVDHLNELGYEVICADTTKPIQLNEKFDVIVIGNLIEHLSSFEGLLLNVNSLLAEHGVCLISTANPFYREQYFYSAFKNDIIVNPEHTCWLCPTTLNQLVTRFGLVTLQVHWIKERWSLGRVINQSKLKRFDMYTGVWEYSTPPSRIEKTVNAFVLFFISRTSKWKKLVKKHGPVNAERLIYMRITGRAFDVMWNIYNKFIVTSKINHYELFVAEITVDRNSEN